MNSSLKDAVVGTILLIRPRHGPQDLAKVTRVTKTMLTVTSGDQFILSSGFRRGEAQSTDQRRYGLGCDAKVATPEDIARVEKARRVQSLNKVDWARYPAEALDKVVAVLAEYIPEKLGQGTPRPAVEQQQVRIVCNNTLPEVGETM